jgi:DNA-binding transcriptional LysR family regulator
MQLESLKVFCDVVLHRSFSLAAQANHVSQSAVSQMVGQLERHLHTKLIDRSVRPLQLTALGQAYYDGCRSLIEQYAELEGRIRSEQSQLTANVLVAAIYSVGLGDMEQYVERFHAQEPRFHVHIDYLHPDKVYAKVSEGSADFGLVSFPRKSREMSVLPWRDEEMVVVCPPDHYLANRSSIKPEELSGEKYVGFTRELIIRKHVDRFFRQEGVAVDVTREFDNIDSIKKAIEIAAGVALLPEPTLHREVAAGTLAAIPLAGCRFVRPLGIIQRRNHHLSSSAARFLQLLRKPNPPHPGFSTNGSNGATHKRTTP